MDMEKAGYPRQMEAGLLVVPDGSDAPMVVSELPQAVNAGRLPARTGSARRDGDMCPMGSESLEHAPGREKLAHMDGSMDDRKESKILGMKRRTFWIAVAVLLVLIAAAVGGAIGGTRRSKNDSTATEQVGSTSSTSGSPQNSNATPTTSTPKPTPTANLGFYMQVWELPSYKGRSQIFYSSGGYKLAFLGHSYHWWPGKYTDTWQCSTSTCFNEADKQGWRGKSEKYWPGPAKGNLTDYGLVYLNIVCAHDFNDPGCPGPGDASTYADLPEIETSSKNPTATIVDDITQTESSSETGTRSSAGRSTPAQAGAATTPT